MGSYEINTTALEVYQHNFPGANKAHNIMGLTADQLERLHPHLVMMSPPCQPFTRFVCLSLLVRETVTILEFLRVMEYHDNCSFFSPER